MKKKNYYVALREEIQTQRAIYTDVSKKILAYKKLRTTVFYQQK